MLLVQALSISRPIWQALSAGAFEGCVQAVFERACTLVGNAGQVMALVTPEVGDGPLNVVLDRTASMGVDFAVGQQVESRDAGLCIGSGAVVIEWRAAALWQPGPDWERLALRGRAGAPGAPDGAYLFDWLRRELAIRPSAELAWRLLGSEPEGICQTAYVTCEEERCHPANVTSLLYDKLRRAAWALLAALTAQDGPAAESGAAELAGLGYGLTPCGDDFLVGVMAWLWLAAAGQSPPVVCHGLAQTAAAKTSLLSAALLQAAACGQFSPAWHALFDALVDGSAERLEAAARQVLAYGHSSGADALAGFVMAALKVDKLPATRYNQANLDNSLYLEVNDAPCFSVSTPAGQA